MRIVITTFLTFLVANVIYSQKYDSRIAETDLPLSEIELVLMPSLDNEALLKAELERRGPGIAPRFAETMTVDITPETYGQWEELPGEMAVWRLRILSKEAHSLNLGFTKFLMPEGGSLILYDPNRKRVMGPFTPSDNEEHEQLWTPVFDGEELVIEVQLPHAKRSELGLQLTSVNHDFVGFFNVSSGSCNLDVICSEPDGWALLDAYRDIIQSVAVYSLGGSTICTGFLVNNARNDCTPYFMTADHCGVTSGNAASLVASWNYQNSFCRQPNSPQSGNNGDGNTNDFNTGSIYRAGWEDTDFTLVELDDELSSTANGFFAGWSRVDTPPQDTLICIHHPNTEEKRISFDFDDAVISDLQGNDTPNGFFVKANDWDIGTTEGGSSGSPLFDKNKRVVGQEFGGFAACGNDDPDWYGWFHISWEGNGTSGTRLKDWLDPDNTGIMTLDGRWQEACNFAVTPIVPEQSVCASMDAVFDLSVSENFTGPVTITLSGVPDGANANLSTNPATPGDMITLTISNTAGLTPGNYLIQITGEDGTEMGTSQVTLTIISEAPEAATLLSPLDGATGLSVFQTLEWQVASGATVYDLQVATDASFNNVILDLSGFMVTMMDITGLESDVTYYWRVRSSNICGISDWSNAFSFETGSCSGGGAIDVPIELSDTGTPTITSTLDVIANGFINSFRVINLDISHTWVGDLTITLTSPDGDDFILIQRPGEPDSYFGCDGDNLLLNFDDNATDTANDLENSCGNAPAITGTFQPIDPFTPLLGTEATGTWTLTISDAAEPDGGFLNGWAIEVCSSFPNNATLMTSISAGEVCTGDEMTFDLIVGSGYTGDVTLSANNVPVNGMVTFSENPAAPGSTVTVTVNGTIAEGDYTLNITGSDNISSANANVDLTVNSIPSNFEGLSPASGTVDVPSGILLTWESSIGANSYNLVVATDPAFSNVFLNTSTTGTTFNLSNLDLGTTYYWTVIANNDCGSNTFDPFNFETEIDLSFAVLPTALNICQTDSPTLTINVGAGFTHPASLSHSVSPVGNFDVSYDADPDDVAGGDQVIATLGNLHLLPKGTYTLTFTIDDGANGDTFDVLVNLAGAPEFPDLLAPENGLVLFDPNPVFNWSTINDADGYSIEIANDDQFSDIIVSENVGNITNYTSTDLNTGGNYFWRVVTLNECGSSTTAASDFSLILVGLNELNGRTVSFLPNPTADLFQIQFSAPLQNDLTVEVFSVNGQVLQQQQYSISEQVEVNLGEYPSGVYLVRLVNEEASLTKRVVLQK